MTDDDFEELMHIPDGQEDMSMENIKICCRCGEDVDELYEALCEEKPELLTNAPIGMYHCRDCGAMVIAGLPHGTVCLRCRDLNHPSFDKE